MCSITNNNQNNASEASKSFSDVSSSGYLTRSSCSSSTSNSSGCYGQLNPKLKVYSFHEDYLNLCHQSNRQPVNFFKLNPTSTRYALKIFADQIKFQDWELIIGALRTDSALLSISVQNRRVGILKLDNFDCIDTREKAQRFDRVPVILTRFLMLKFTGGLSQCLSKTDVLNHLHLEALPLRSDYINLLCKGLEKNSSLGVLALPNCLIGDQACAVLCRTLKHVPNIKVLDLTGSGLSQIGAGSIVEVIKFQQLWRTGQCWEQGLRYRKLDPEAISGLRRVTLSHNMIGDEGALRIIDALADDNFIKAMDLQDCNLTELIFPCLLELIDVNNQLLIFDVRLNQLRQEMVWRIMDQLQVDRVRSQEWRWLRAEASLNNVWKSGSKLRKTTSGTTNSKSSSGSSHQNFSESGSDIQLAIAPVSGISEFSKVPESGIQEFSKVPQSGVVKFAPNVIKLTPGCLVALASAAEEVVGPTERVGPERCPECGCGPPVQWAQRQGVKLGSCGQKSDPENGSGNDGSELGDGDRNVKEASACWCKDGSRQRQSTVNGANIDTGDTDVDSSLTDSLKEQPPEGEKISQTSFNKALYTGSREMFLGKFCETSLEKTGSVEKFGQTISQTNRNSAKQKWDENNSKTHQTSLGVTSSSDNSNQTTQQTSLESGMSELNENHFETQKTSSEVLLTPNGGKFDQNSHQTSLISTNSKPSTDQTSSIDNWTSSKSKGTVTHQTSLKDVLNCSSNERTGLFCGSDESILHAVFLGRKRTNNSMKGASTDSDCTVSSSGNSSNSTNASDSSDSVGTGVSSGTSHSSRETFVKLLLKRSGKTSNTSATNCKL